MFQTAQVRIDLARAVMREEGIDVIGEVGDPDPYAATMDAVAEHSPDEIIISTFPATSSGWMRRDLIERVSEASGLPVHHVVADIDEEGLPFPITLTVANRTTTSDALLELAQGARARPPPPVHRRRPPGGRRGPRRPAGPAAADASSWTGCARPA